MSLKLVIDICLSPEWVAELARHGRTAVHWSDIGNANDPDSTIMNWASANDHIVFTHDLDFTTLLALSHASGPSVVQLRGQAVLPEDIGSMVAAALDQHEAALSLGALVVVDVGRSRVRVLPL